MITFLWHKIHSYRFTKKSICLNLIPINKLYSMMLMNLLGWLWRRETRRLQTPVLCMMFPYLGGGSGCLLTTKQGSSGQTWDLNAKTGGWYFYFFVLLLKFSKVLLKAWKLKCFTALKPPKMIELLCTISRFLFQVISVILFA